MKEKKTDVTYYAVSQELLTSLGVPAKLFPIGANPNARHPNGAPALCWACRNKNKEAIEL